jgi:hypothetical protein
MRIRLRAPEDGGEKRSGFGAWLRSLFSPTQTSAIERAVEKPAAAPAPPRKAPPPPADKRWKVCGESRFLHIGRLYTQTGGEWQCAYLFDVVTGDEQLPTRIVLPEAPVLEWEKQHGKRMTEASRMGLAVAMLEGLVTAGRAGSTMTLPAADVESVAP